MWLPPPYADVAKTVVNSGGVDIMKLIDWVDGYAERWGFKDSAVSASLAVHDWCMRREPWVERSRSFGKQAGKYLDIVLLSSSASPWSEDVRSRHLLAQVARKILAVMTNAADPERVFSELGRMITSSRTRLDDAQSTQMFFIAADCRTQRRQDAADRGPIMQRPSKNSRSEKRLFCV
jgi:hAT family C-terminal dimerisation region